MGFDLIIPLRPHAQRCIVLLYIWSAILSMSSLSVRAFHSSSNVREIQKGSDFIALVEVSHKTRGIFKIPRTTNSAPIEFQFPLQVIIVFTTL